MPNRLKNWAAAMPPCLERSPTEVPAFATAAQGVTSRTLGTGSDSAGGGASGDAGSASTLTSVEAVVDASVPIVAVERTCSASGGVSIAGAIFLVLELDRPFGGLIHISDAPMRSTLDHLGK